MYCFIFFQSELNNNIFLSFKVNSFSHTEVFVAVLKKLIEYYKKNNAFTPLRIRKIAMTVPRSGGAFRSFDVLNRTHNYVVSVLQTHNLENFYSAIPIPLVKMCEYYQT